MKVGVVDEKSRSAFAKDMTTRLDHLKNLRSSAHSESLMRSKVRKELAKRDLSPPKNMSDDLKAVVMTN